MYSRYPAVHCNRGLQPLRGPHLALCDRKESHGQAAYALRPGFQGQKQCHQHRSREQQRHHLYQTQLSTGSGNSHRSVQPARQYRHSVSVTMAATDSSPVEIKFAKLMAFLSISFVICWMPQMVSTGWIPF